MAKKDPEGKPIYLGKRDDSLRKAIDQAASDYDSSKRACTYESERKEVTEAYMDHVMDIGMMARMKGDWAMVTECEVVLDSLQSRMYKPKRRRF